MRSRHPSVDRAGDGGFTIIELIVVIAVIPLVIGAISVALISVISQQTTVGDKVTNSGDESVVSATYVKDVQSAQYISTPPNLSPASPTYPWNPCNTSTPIVSMVWPATSTVVVSYAAVKPVGSRYYSLYRYYCQGLIKTSSVVAHQMKAVPTVVISGSSCQVSCTDALTAAGNGWAPTAGISAVVLQVQSAERTTGGTSTYQFSLTGVPRTSNPASLGSNQGGHAPLVLLGSGNPGIDCGGGNSIVVNGNADINSTTTAIRTNGGGTVSATNIYTAATGSNVFNGNNITPPSPTATGVQTSDPYAGLPPPATGLPIPNSYHDGDTYPSNYSTVPPFTVRTSGGYEGPGLYTKGLSIGSAQTLQSGIYVIEGGLSLSGSGAINSGPGGVLLYIYSGNVSITGNGGLNLQPLTNPPAPIPLHLTIWMDSSDTSGLVKVEGSGKGGGITTIGGTVYAPSVNLVDDGNGSVNVGSLVTDSVTCQGGGTNGQITIG